MLQDFEDFDYLESLTPSFVLVVHDPGLTNRVSAQDIPNGSNFGSLKNVTMRDPNVDVQ